MVIEAAAVEELGPATPAETAGALATLAAGVVADIFVGSVFVGSVFAGTGGRLAAEQAERTSNATEPMSAQDLFTNAARFRRCRPGNDVAASVARRNTRPLCTACGST
jgi:hypothetical protein